MKMVILVVGAILLTGCAHTRTVWVYVKETRSQEKAINTAGIPFYVKVEKFEQNTKWSQTWVDVTLTVNKSYQSESAKDKKPTITQVFTKHFTKDQLENLIAIKKEVLSLNQGDDVTIKNIIDEFNNLPALEDTDKTVVVLISNAVKSMWVVDGSKTYYLNAPLPWFGTNTLSHQLNGDGTLSTASSAPDTKLAEGISNLIPIKEYLTGKFVTPLTRESDKSINTTLNLMSLVDPAFSAAQAKAKRDTSSFIYQVSISLEEKGYIYTFSKQFDTNPSNITPIEFNASNGLFVREQITAKNTESKKDSDTKSIGFQGAITLPKDDAKQ